MVDQMHLQHSLSPLAHSGLEAKRPISQLLGCPQASMDIDPIHRSMKYPIYSRLLQTGIAEHHILPSVRGPRFPNFEI